MGDGDDSSSAGAAPAGDVAVAETAAPATPSASAASLPKAGAPEQPPPTSPEVPPSPATPNGVSPPNGHGAATPASAPPTPATPQHGEDEDEGEDEGDVDPRVEGELMALNQSAEDVNTFEGLLTKAKDDFKKALGSVHAELQEMLKKVGKRSVERSRPYHDALFQARKAHYEARQAAIYYERASDRQRKAKSRVKALEQRLESGAKFTDELQKQLNDFSEAVVQADTVMQRASELHSNKTQRFLEADATLMALAKDHKKFIIKSKPYFDCKGAHDKRLWELKQLVQKHEKAVKDAKERYKTALKNLEVISNEIHQEREKRKAALSPGSSAAEAESEERLRKEIAAADERVREFAKAEAEAAKEAALDEMQQVVEPAPEEDSMSEGESGNEGADEDDQAFLAEVKREAETVTAEMASEAASALEAEAAAGGADDGAGPAHDESATDGQGDAAGAASSAAAATSPSAAQALPDPEATPTPGSPEVVDAE